MSSSISLEKSSVDRKSLKKPDLFTTVTNAFFNRLASQSGRVIVGLGVLLIIGLSIAFWMNHREAVESASRNELFLAEKSIREEMKALTASQTSQNPNPTQPGRSLEAKAIASAAFKKLDVDSQFKKSLEAFKLVESRYPSTRAALDARFKLAGLYFDHGDYQKALPWYQKAALSSSGFEKASALSALGYTYENLGKPQEAVESYQKALNLGEESLKGDLLLAIARSYEAAHDNAKARSTYDQVLRDLPNTEYARSAELYKDQLH